MRSSAFGGLCTLPSELPTPLPAVRCAGPSTAAVCPPATACGADLLCHPIQIDCRVDADCPQHERCNPVCASAGGTIGHVCQPDGLPTRDCGPEQCTVDGDCPHGDRCAVLCPTSTGQVVHECIPLGAIIACP